ncbi:hypothetical protein LZ30DRAFT_7372 [Colletotrichum cereale]|nr:hypothetical protein LZ30DRAFT_7372 [Colletotrichum cereale]
MDHDQSRSPFDETAGRDHVDGAFAHNFPPDNTSVPLEFSFTALLNDDLGPYAYAVEVDLFHADPGPEANLPAHSPSQFLPPALDSVQLQDPRQALAEVYDQLPLRISNGHYGFSDQYGNLWNHPAAPPPSNPVAANAPPYLPPQHNYATTSSTVTPSQSTRSLFDASHLGPNPTPSFPSDSLSNYSGDTSTSSGREKCDVCGQSVGSGLMRRHRQDVHRQEGDQMYICKCGHADPAMRRGNHKRHLNTCKRTNDSQLVFTCRCGNTLGDEQDHLNHIRGCKSRRWARSAS